MEKNYKRNPVVKGKKKKDLVSLGITETELKLIITVIIDIK